MTQTNVNNNNSFHSDLSFGSKNTNIYIENLKCGSLNVCGLKRRVNYPEFRDLIQNHDLFCVNETKLDQYDLINISGYTFLSKCRKRFLRKSGGIGVFVKDSLVPFVTMIGSESEYILWFRVNKQILCTDEDFLFGAVYLPPSDSRYNTSDELENFEFEITSMCILHKYVYLMGDYNSRAHLRSR